MNEPDDQACGFIAGIILGLIVTLLILLLTTPSWGQATRRFPPDDSLSCELWDICKPPPRLVPEDPALYKVPRSVGAWSGAGDMQQAPMRWWSLTNTEPTWQTFERMRSYGTTAVGKFMRAHPTDNITAYNECGELLADASTNNENIRRAFRTDGIDIVVIRPEHWGSLETGCNGRTALRWENYPSTLYQDMYKFYAGQDKAIFIMSLEADLQLYGVGCKDGDCIPFMGYSCDEVLDERRRYLVRLFDERQAAAMAARSMYPGAALRVFHAIEVNFFGAVDWQDVTVLADVIPDMMVPPDFIALSIWPAAGDPLDALYYAMEMTGLPARRFFISQVGAREGSQPDGRFFYLPHQRDRLMYVIPPLFDAGVAFALVWSMEQPEPTGWTGHSIIDHVTGERLSGWETIIELNNLYR